MFFWFPSVSAACIKPVASCNTSMNYFDTPSFKYSTTVSNVVNHNTWIEFTLNSLTSSSRIILVQCGCPIPSESGTKISVPVGSAMISQTVTIPKVTDLGQLSILTMVEDSSFITSSSVVDAITSGRIVDVQYDYSLVNANRPDVIITGAGNITTFGASGSINNPTWYGQTYTAALEALRFDETDQYESTPLGRAELVKLYGLLFGVSSTAIDLFASIERNYNSAKAIAAAASTRRPSVAKGVPFSGMWSLVAKDKYFGKFFEDANVDFISGADVTALSLETDQFTELFSQTGFWIDALTYAPDGSLMTEDKIYNLPNTSVAVLNKYVALQCNQVYSNDNKLTKTGNAFFEAGVMRPDLILSDLVQILHPETYTDRQLYFYRKVTPTTNPAYVSGRPACPLSRIVTSSTLSLTRRSFTVNGISRAMFDNLIPNVIKPQVMSALGLSSDQVDIYVKNDLSKAPAFTVELVLGNSPSSIDKMAATLQNDFSNSFVSILSRSASAYQSATPNTYSLLTEKPSAVSAEPAGDVWVEQANGANYLYKPTGLSTGQIVGIVFGVLLGVALIIAASSFVSYRAGYYAYQKLSEKTPMIVENQ